MVVRDFNAVSSQEEKMGECPINLNDVAEFLDMIRQASLNDEGYSGSKYTGQTITKRCSHCREAGQSISQQWMDIKFFTTMDQLNRACSDHFLYLSPFKQQTIMVPASDLLRHALLIINSLIHSRKCGIHQLKGGQWLDFQTSLKL